MKPHQLSGGGYITLRLRSSWGIPSKPGASVGLGDIPAMAIRPAGVGIGPAHGMATARSVRRDATIKVVGLSMASSCQQLVSADPTTDLINSGASRRKCNDSGIPQVFKSAHGQISVRLQPRAGPAGRRRCDYHVSTCIGRMVVNGPKGSIDSYWKRPKKRQSQD